MEARLQSPATFQTVSTTQTHYKMTHRLSDHDRLRIGSSDLGDQFIRPSWESQRSSIITFRLPVTVQTHNSDDNVRFLGQFNGIGHGLVRVLNLSTPQTHSRVTGKDARKSWGNDVGDESENTPIHDSLVLISISRSTNVAELNVDLVFFTSHQVVHTRLLNSTHSEERIATALASPVVDHEVTVDVQLEASNSLER
jgi:hypothetical protein